jgi:hypothetical protein
MNPQQCDFDAFEEDGWPKKLAFQREREKGGGKEGERNTKRHIYAQRNTRDTNISTKKQTRCRKFL